MVSTNYWWTYLLFFLLVVIVGRFVLSLGIQFLLQNKRNSQFSIFLISRLISNSAMNSWHTALARPMAHLFWQTAWQLGTQMMYRPAILTSISMCTTPVDLRFGLRRLWMTVCVRLSFSLSLSIRIIRI